MKRHTIIGTAGHIDHGKTALIKALTGIDADRLKEEKDRGITIDIGFAYWRDDVTIIDVPGHEKFIRNMVAGVSTIDFFLLVIAADDGIMPQTIEHLDILNFFNINFLHKTLLKIHYSINCYPVFSLATFFSFSLAQMATSTRRFWARPAAVSLVATG